MNGFLQYISFIFFVSGDKEEEDDVVNCFTIIVDEELTLPHPRFVNRNFVITPLSEVLTKEQKIKKIQDMRWSKD